ncbi:tripartite tricarboxylate transporter substrate binding protein [Roseococcus sp. SYP-B2431]|uniref:Bug family tripartite tricarboxylate transporter substrate binding protein n=1 Tax=Roseococcus sp. SYP-B2431 TaxID=2496640 RepID=UPI0013F3D3CD|nr:tripartite tricarboxylate transporter substrate binding protein [Roseococcus sp. SYP-B2431]
MMPNLPRRLALGLPALLPAGRALAAWPERPIRLIAPFPPGSGTDILARIIAEPLSRVTGQPVVVENRPGANGVVGAQAAATAPADGTVLLMMGTSVGAINPHTVRRLPYDPARDFAPVGTIAEQPYILVAPPNAPGDLAAWLEAARGRDLTYGYGNAGSLIMGAMLARMAGLKVTGVPYRGSTDALNDLSAGRVDFSFADFGAGLEQGRNGRIRLLAQTLGNAFPLAPDLPLLASAVPGFDAGVWFSVVTPAATSPEIVRQMETALDRVVRDAAFGQRLVALGLAPMHMGSADFGRFLAQQIGAWGERVRMAGIEPQ